MSAMLSGPQWVNKWNEVVLYEWNEVHDNDLRESNEVHGSDSVHVLLKVFLLWMSVDFCENSRIHVIIPVQNELCFICCYSMC